MEAKTAEDLLGTTIDLALYWKRRFEEAGAQAKESAEGMDYHYRIRLHEQERAEKAEHLAEMRSQSALEECERARKAEARVKELETEVEVVRHYSRLQEDAATRGRRIENMEEVEAELRASLKDFQASKKAGKNA